MKHIPVLLNTVCSVLSPVAGEKVLDVTLGLGGHAAEFLEAITQKGFLVGLDADAVNLQDAKHHLRQYTNTLFLHSNFSALPDVLPSQYRSFDVIFADLGLSSPHIDIPERGFTFRSNAPLDMRFDQSRGESAARVLQASDPITLRKIFHEYGELPQVVRLVQAIVRRRSSDERIRTSDDLKTVAEEVYSYRAPKVLPQIFQALRIYVNDELGSLRHFLTVAGDLLAVGGRLGVISYHSLEDRIVKEQFKSCTTPPKDPMTGSPVAHPKFELLLKKPLMPLPAEVQMNPRSRSAVFRAIIKRSL